MSDAAKAQAGGAGVKLRHLVAIAVGVGLAMMASWFAYHVWWGALAG